MTEPGTDSPAWLASALQLFDSALPTGAYAHSQGLEGLVRDGWITRVAEVEAFICTEVAASLIHVDLPLLRAAHGIPDRAAWEEILPLDELAEALRPTRELRQCGSRTGRQAWRLFGELLDPDSAQARNHSMCGEYLNTCQAPVVLGLLAGLLGIPPVPAMLAYARQAVVNFAQPCIKLLNSGPTETQRLIYSCARRLPEWVEVSREIPLDEAGCSIPLWDIASSRHQYAAQRLYIS